MSVWGSFADVLRGDVQDRNMEASREDFSSVMAARASIDTEKQKQIFLIIFAQKYHIAKGQLESVAQAMIARSKDRAVVIALAKEFSVKAVRMLELAANEMESFGNHSKPDTAASAFVLLTAAINHGVASPFFTSEEFQGSVISQISRFILAADEAANRKMTFPKLAVRMLEISGKIKRSAPDPHQEKLMKDISDMLKTGTA